MITNGEHEKLVELEKSQPEGFSGESRRFLAILICRLCRKSSGRAIVVTSHLMYWIF